MCASPSQMAVISLAKPVVNLATGECCTVLLGRFELERAEPLGFAGRDFVLDGEAITLNILEIPPVTGVTRVSGVSGVSAGQQAD